ncbi:MAG: hypothetical protein ABW046_19630 [Actinoplanes sp.]
MDNNDPPAQPPTPPGPPWQQPSPWQPPGAGPAQPGPWQPPVGPPAPGPQPWSGQPPVGGMPWGPPTPPPRKPRSRAVTALIVAVSVIGVACFGSAVWGLVRFAKNMNAAVERNEARERRFTLPDDPSAAPSLESDETPGPAVTGPRPSTYPVREADDLGRVCEGWYYPQSPKYAGKAPHQINVGKVTSKDFDSRLVSSFVSVPYNLSEKTRDAWWPKDPGKSQLMACVDLKKTGAQLKTCKFDDPKSDITKVPLKQGVYQLRLYEVATGKKLLDKPVTGEGEDCPPMVLLGADRSIYSEVDDRQLYELLRKYVMKK